ncbi:MAG: hypothetical protein B7Y12_02135 [Rhizobiales bacterium 24-66-13]|jgi:SPP1 gp7 family putative phage head morphogenesis protein|nr:MAG: hypothetical protein B7Y61_01165 [Rhizobiales bacterium 35-66-30]OYZ82814.1 MAG: hypothetical protein B7Y12_02135 [Rhizobiales bacterium 24-66-13]OZB11847.1 MAG: hypothetical protein B7X67_02115 [Rhizobiales bacterium 39-66-18]HQS08728.1 phage minor head protein [Xanthobacteraceae bacterium]HQS45929.1 phage minor head protein [Xanthobacteraceae bacterium]
MAIRLDARPPADAIAALEARGKKLAPSFSYLDVWQQEHADQFTVAKSAGFDILTDIYGGLQDALKEGKTGRQFAADLKPFLEKKGWWGRKDVVDPLTGETVSAQLGSSRRLQTIFDANMRVSYAVGHWTQFERTKATRPYLRYVAVMDGRTRPEHAKRHNLCLPVDHPYWNTWAPPCGWSCRCTLQSLSQRDVDRMRGQLKFEPPVDDYRPWTNKRTGEVLWVPQGIDPGWAHNPGKAGHQAVIAAEKLAAAPPRLAAAEVSDPAWPAEKLADEFATWFDAAAANKRVERTVFPAGAMDAPTLDFLAARGTVPQTGAVTVSAPTVLHMIRDAKQLRGTSVPARILRRLPELIRRPKAILYDRRNPALLYVFDVEGEARLGKLVVRVDFRDKTRVPEGGTVKVTTNSVRTAGLVKATILQDSNAYELISGSLE